MLDSITVGNDVDSKLKCVSFASGGYAFHPKTLRAALRLNELETVLSARNRAPRELVVGGDAASISRPQKLVSTRLIFPEKLWSDEGAVSISRCFGDS